jgi:uncharacterized coiled-coil DUF342 family protein
MSTGPAFSKDSLLGQIWSISTTLTEEAMSSASTKAKELGFDTNRGLIPLSESFINLSSARALLEDAIEKQKLVQLPITVQKGLLSNLETIQRSLQGLASGVDEIVNLTNAIEALNTSIWTYGLHNLSDQVLGYQKKLNQLKNHEVQVSKIMDQLKDVQRTAEKVAAAALDTEQTRAETFRLLEQVDQAARNSATLLEEVKDARTQASALFATVQQNEKQSGELTANIKTASNELAALDASIKKFYGEVDDYRRKINQTNDDASRLITDSEAIVKKLIEDTAARVNENVESLKASAGKTADDLTIQVTAKVTDADDRLKSLAAQTTSTIAQFQDGVESRLTTFIATAESSTKKLVTETEQNVQQLKEGLAKESEETIGANQKRTEALIEELEKLKGLIREQLQQATGFTLFGAFQSRQNQIANSKKWWVRAIAALVAASVLVTAWIAYEAQSYNVHGIAFWVKLSLTIPIGYAIWFCTAQYSKERRLEEEYAFKASISASLNPYRDLVHSILEKDGQSDLSKYTEFVIGSVDNVFTSPTERVLDGEAKDGVDQALKETLNQIATLVGTAVKAAK